MLMDSPIVVPNWQYRWRRTKRIEISIALVEIRHAAGKLDHRRNSNIETSYRRLTVTLDIMFAHS